MNYIKTVALCFGLVLLLSCNTKNQHVPHQTRQITDFAGREVIIPDTVSRVVCIRPGCIKMVIMAGGVDFISGIEDAEREKSRYVHSIAHPQLLEKEVIGPRFGGDHELIFANRPDVIFMSSTTTAAANDLQNKLNIPVIVIEAGDFGKNYNKFCQSLQIIGEALGTSLQVDSLLAYIAHEKSELKKRTANLESTNAYVGAISYKGERDLTATDPYYPSLSFIGVDNVAAHIDSTIISPMTGTFVDYEQIIAWNPNYIFVDRAGIAKADECFRTKPSLNNLMQAYHNNQIYMIWPYNNYHSNFEVLLLNAWYMAKCIYPNEFADISISQKGNEIFNAFYGKPIYPDLCSIWGEYQPLKYSSPLGGRVERNPLNK